MSTHPYIFVIYGGIFMKMRAPATPLITVDPYFSVWSMADSLTDATTKHWTGKPNTMIGTAEIDGKEYIFMGDAKELNIDKLYQKSVNIDALSTTYVFAGAGIELTLKFTTPCLPDDLMLYSRPLTYLKADVKSTDGKQHNVKLTVKVSEEICLDLKGQFDVTIENVSAADGVKTVKMGSVDQPVLARCGDDIRIDWGYFYLSVKGENAETGSVKKSGDDDMNYVTASAELDVNGTGALFAFAYDDIDSIVYFGDHLKAYWKKDGASIEDVIASAYSDYDALVKRSDEFSDKLFCDATRAGGEKYAELLELAFRQVVAAHKLVLDNDGEILYISKECFSNGCAATVDVSYPSIPMFLYYCPELVKGMARPIFKYADSDLWKFKEFAPHDAGTYPHLNGQAYACGGTRFEDQMPVEECGNMLLMIASAAAAENDASFAEQHMDTIKLWVDYLVKHGTDPENQLCTDDFAGHLAHNCNLSLKAIMAIAAFSVIENLRGNTAEAQKYIDKAKEMAAVWMKTADNGDGSYRLAFDQPGTFSMKYNVVWDVILGTNIFPKEVIQSEFASYRRHINKYGMPLDNRETYTKSDWLVWTGTLAQTRTEFEEYVNPLWEAYNATESRVPMTDWYFTVTALHRGFQHRTVQGGLFIKLLDESGKCAFYK